MRVTLLDIYPGPDGCNTVLFTSSYGTGRGTWRGPVRPIRGDYDVEIEVPNALNWGLDIGTVGSNSFGMDTCQEGMTFEGPLEMTYDEGVSVVRIGNSVVSLQTVGTPCPVGSYVRFVARRVELYETGV